MTVNLMIGWVGMAAGVLSGAVIGLFFHDENWMGGYGSFRRRMARLGHISFFGLGMLNILFAVSVAHLPASTLLHGASIAFIVGAVTMPICCFLTAWRRPWRHLFPIPVLATLAAIVLLLTGGVWP